MQNTLTISQEFEKLREELEPIISSWPAKFPILLQRIHNEPNKAKRLSCVVEYNRFRDMYFAIAHLKNDNTAVPKNTNNITGPSPRTAFHPG